ncbi:MAG: ATP-binding protein [Planctomycetales bacterium]
MSKAPKKLTVVISQAQGKNPTKRHLEEELAATLLFDPEIEVSLVPNLYDLTADHSGMLFLKSVPGNMVVLSWLYPRAARWILDRNLVKGELGVSLLKGGDDDESDEDQAEEAPVPEERPNALGAWEVPKRKIYCLDLRAYTQAQPYLDEIRRIAREGSVQTVELMSWIKGTPQPEQLQRYLNPLAAAGNGNGQDPPSASRLPVVPVNGAADSAEGVKRRWYPVIDYSRCTNCMECIDFCLFGVYGLDGAERILVEQQDNCKKGCPACSRVCPENAIIFPEHKTPGIAGADDGGGVSGLKIDLSKLFGAPSALEEAVLERDTELVRDGRDAVGMSVGVPKRQSGQQGPRDALDDLMDGLDALEG